MQVYVVVEDGHTIGVYSNLHACTLAASEVVNVEANAEQALEAETAIQKMAKLHDIDAHYTMSGTESEATIMRFTVNRMR